MCAPSDASTIEDVVAAIMDWPYGAQLLVTGDLNVNLVDPEGTPREEAITDKITEAGLMDMCLHFFPQRNPWLKDRCM